MKHTIKAPATVRELGVLAEKLGMDLPEVLDLLDDSLGKNWWNYDHEDFTLETVTIDTGLGRLTADQIRAELDRRGVGVATPPAGYELAEGCSDHYNGPERVTSGWIITQTWNAAMHTHSLELWMANHEPPSYAQLSPVQAFDLAADIITAARAAESAGKAEGSPAGAAE